MFTLLLVEDDMALATGLLFTFEEEGYRTLHAPTATSALEAFARENFDLVIMDVMLPDGNGFDLCRALRQTSEAPVIFLTSCDEETNVVMGLDTGGDDYVTKPFRLKELLSRIKVQLRRHCQPLSSSFTVGDILIDTSQSKAMVASAELPLTVTEYRLLCYLCQNKGNVLTREAILAKLWDHRGNFVDDNTLSVHIGHLREKLSKAGSVVNIATVRGIGYRLEVGA